MANNHRTLGNVAKGIWIRLLSITAQFTFPAQVTTTLHRWRGMRIGKGSKISRTVIVDDSRPDLITIGKNVWVTAGCQLLCHQRDLSFYEVGKPVMDCPLKYAPIVIGDGAHIGIGSIIMPGVTIGEGAVIGAGAVVTRDVPMHCVAVGSPAKVIKSFVESVESTGGSILQQQHNYSQLVERVSCAQSGPLRGRQDGGASDEVRLHHPCSKWGGVLFFSPQILQTAMAA